jgi:hypothetical protein
MLRFCVPFAALALGACAPAATPAGRPAPVPAQVQETGSGLRIQLGAVEAAPPVAVNRSPDDVWAALPQVYASLGIRPDAVDPSTRTYGSQRVTQLRIGDRRTASYVRCGNEGAGPSAASGYRIQLSILTRLAPTSAGTTEVTTEVTGFATSVEGGSTGAIRCVSNGELERHIAALLKAPPAS